MTIALAFKPGRNYDRDRYGTPNGINYPGCYDQRFDVHQIYGFKSVGAANATGYRYYRRGIAEHWWVNKGW